MTSLKTYELRGLLDNFIYADSWQLDWEKVAEEAGYKDANNARTVSTPLTSHESLRIELIPQRCLVDSKRS